MAGGSTGTADVGCKAGGSGRPTACIMRVKKGEHAKYLRQTSHYSDTSEERPETSPGEVVTTNGQLDHERYFRLAIRH